MAKADFGPSWDRANDAWRWFRRTPLALQCLTYALASLCAVMTLTALLSLGGTKAPGGASLLGVTPSSASRFRLHTDLGRLRSAPSAQTRQSDLFISVKTSKQFHKSRLEVILDTWFTLARSETWFFTDDPDDDIDARTSE